MYKKRIADNIVVRKLSSKGAVLIEGPKWCGKTTTASKLAKSVLDLGDSLVLKNSTSIFEINPYILLEGKTPRLIDEWQTIPALWDTIRSAVDKRGLPSQFILTGSAITPDAKACIHSGTGRYSRVRMRTMSLFESGESTGSVSLNELFDNKSIDTQSNHLTINDISFLLCRGGWPMATMMKGEVALDQAIDYYDSIVDFDIKRVDGVKRDSQRARKLLRSFARNIATQVSYATYKTDMASNDSDTLNEDTVADYLKALKMLYVVEDLEAWNPNLRSKAAIRTGDTRYLVDPSIATAALGIGPKDLINDLNTFGLIFENMAVRDLRVYADALSGKLYHYRDNTGLECDAVLHRRNGTYGLIEIKLGGESKIKEAVTSLTALANKIDTTKMPSPSFKMVLTAVGDYAYTRPDGIHIVPIGCLTY